MQHVESISTRRVCQLINFQVSLVRESLLVCRVSDSASTCMGRGTVDKRLIIQAGPCLFEGCSVRTSGTCHCAISLHEQTLLYSNC